jgi:hypothetical protein
MVSILFYFISTQLVTGDKKSLLLELQPSLIIPTTRLCLDCHIFQAGHFCWGGEWIKITAFKCIFHSFSHFPQETKNMHQTNTSYMTYDSKLRNNGTVQ